MSRRAVRAREKKSHWLSADFRPETRDREIVECMRDFFLPIMRRDGATWPIPHQSLLLIWVFGRPNGVSLGWWRRMPLPIAELCEGSF
jgi:hypothetical protein